MPHTQALYDWTQRVAARFTTLSPAEASVLALYSFGLVLARTSGLTTIAVHLALVLGRSANTVRQRLRELYQPAAVKAGRSRRELDPAACVGPLVRWVTAGGADRRLVLALDPTHVGDRFIILAVSAVYQGCAVPLAWHVVTATTQGGWNAHWARLLGQVHAALGDGWEVLVVADRGLESRDLFLAVTALGWHPLLRVKARGTFRPDGWKRHWPLARFAAAVGRRWGGRGVAYQRDAALPCTLLACWDEGHAEPWLLLTDLEPEAANPAWYAFRAWIEQGFKVLKRGGWQWQRSRVTDPLRAARQWAALALATLWLLEIGQEGERLHLPRRPDQPRAVRLFQVGLAVVLAALVRGAALPAGALSPEPWPAAAWEPDPLTEEQLDQQVVYP
jgi:hypothetical protein